MSQLLQTLKLTSARKQRALPEVVKRRNKMLKKLTEQRDLVARATGKPLDPAVFEAHLRRRYLG